MQRLAPQLVAFAGSQSNFLNLVTGLAQGTPVQLVSVLPDGSAQIVGFTPAVALTPEQIAQTLETARQRLIGLGIGAPSAERIALSLTGGTVPTVLGGAQLPGLLNSPNTLNNPSPAVQVQAASPMSLQSSSAATQLPAAPRFNTSDSPLPAGATSRSPTPPTGPTSASGTGSTPPTLERATPIAPASAPTPRH
ncbi:MAG TPA: hypothetical protein VFR66_15290 [Burkholderiales bacterium]|nr:hypothetical protein [Burkholderiales bacterium]